MFLIKPLLKRHKTAMKISSQKSNKVLKYSKINFIYQNSKSIWACRRCRAVGVISGRQWHSSQRRIKFRKNNFATSIIWRPSNFKSHKFHLVIRILNLTKSDAPLKDGESTLNTQLRWTLLDTKYICNRAWS